MAGINQIVFPITRLPMSSATAANGFGMLPEKSDQALEFTIYVSFLANVSAGVLKIESSYSRDYDGTWPAEATVTFAGTAPNMQVVHLTALNKAIRVRISTEVANGTCEVYYMAANRGV